MGSTKSERWGLREEESKKGPKERPDKKKMRTLAESLIGKGKKKSKIQRKREIARIERPLSSPVAPAQDRRQQKLRDTTKEVGNIRET